MILGIFGCSKTPELYTDPPWLGGSNIETLKARGNYSIFLKLMDQANYTVPITKQLFTLFVPDDAAFEKYFQENGINSVEDLSKDQSVQLFTLHVLRNPRSRFQLIYEYAWSELQGPDGEYASLFMRKEVPSVSAPYTEFVKYSPANRIGQTLKIYTDNKFVPLFTTDWFEDYGGALDGSDYTFMYPNSQWGGNMNWHSSMVIDDPLFPGEKEVRTASGFIYFLDKVIPPMPSIEEYLKTNPDKFGLYYDLMQRFANYINPRTNELKEQEYKKSYNDVSNIAEERGTSTNTAVPPQNMFTGFIPSNDVLQAYLDKFIPLYYPSVDSLPKVTLYYILQSQISASLALISKLQHGFFNSFGDALVVTKSDIKDSYMCSNGVVYEMNKVLEPNVFTTVPGELFFNSNYSTFLYALQTANMLTGLSSPDNDVTLFAPTNATIEAYNIRYDKDRLQMQWRGADGIWKAMRATDLTDFVQDHIYYGILDDFTGEGYIKMSSGNFIHYNNGVFEGAENQMLGDNLSIEATSVNDKNGILYKVSNPIKSYVLMGSILMNDPDLSTFADLMTKTKLLAMKPDSYLKMQVPFISFLSQTSFWTGLFPTNAAMAQAQLDGLIPPLDTIADGSVNKDQSKNIALKDFLLYHFIRNYAVFDDGELSGPLPSNRSYVDPVLGTLYSTMTITNNVNNLSITDLSGQTVVVDHANADILVRQGVVHKIDKVLKY